MQVNNNTFKPYKCHCSGLGHITGGNLYPSLNKDATEGFKRLKEGTKLTKAQTEAVSTYNKKMASAPNLSSGGVSKAMLYYTEQKYGRRKRTPDNVYTKKGNLVEDEAIVLAGQMLAKMYPDKISGLTPDKAEDRIEKTNEHFIGTCDKEISELDGILDVKSSYDCFSFPTFKYVIDAIYHAQGQGYLDLYGRRWYFLAYVLCNLPPELMKSECINEARSIGRYDLISDIVAHFDEGLSTTEMDIDAVFVIDKVKEYHTYDHLPLEDRVIIYVFERNDKFIKDAKTSVELVRLEVDKLHKNRTNVRQYDLSRKLTKAYMI